MFKVKYIVRRGPHKGKAGVYRGEGKYAMSALGQKQTFAVQNGMSALPPKADMCSASIDVR